MKVFKKESFLLLIIFISLNACFFEKSNKSKEEPIAKVGINYLYKSDIAGILPEEYTLSDSTILTKNYIDKWVKTRLIVDWAEKNLTEEQKNVEKQIEDYRNSLLIYKYEQKYIKQKLDTFVTDEKIQEYYQENIQNFLLNNNIIKGLYIKIPLSSPNIDKIKETFYSEGEEDIKQLESYCYQYASKYDFFEDKWIYFNKLITKFPDPPENNEYFLKTNKRIISSDSSFLYLLNIKDYKLKGENSPLKFVNEKIKTILINKRKTKLLIDLENDIYNNAVGREYFQIYNQ